MGDMSAGEVKSRSSSAETIGSNQDIPTEILLRMPAQPLLKFKRTTVAGWAMILRPFMRLKRKTTAPTGHSTTPATTNAKNPRVGPTTLHRQGLLVVPHWTHIGKPTPRVILFIAINCPQQDKNNTKRQLPRKNKRLFENFEASNGVQRGKLTKKTASMVEISEWAFNVTSVLRSL
ncbi:hypothetical protein NC652_038580 [Populus alba x Populus x berolinensis]|nr:hypothetical protein NC652_038580 [Populus alba x Populus x berolinensis]